MTELRLGFAGVGKMGGLMAARLIEAGHPLTVFDANDLAVEPLVKAGAKRAKTLRDLAGQAKIVFASLPTPDVVREVALGTGGIVESSTTKLFVDLSTTGAQILSPGALKPNRLVTLLLPIGDGRLACKAKIMWSRLEPGRTGGLWYRAGVSFTSADPKAIEEFLKGKK